jgi:hypothetical protein
LTSKESHEVYLSLTSGLVTNSSEAASNGTDADRRLADAAAARHAAAVAGETPVAALQARWDGTTARELQREHADWIVEPVAVSCAGFPRDVELPAQLEAALVAQERAQTSPVEPDSSQYVAPTRPVDGVTPEAEPS